MVAYLEGVSMHCTGAGRVLNTPKKLSGMDRNISLFSQHSGSGLQAIDSDVKHHVLLYKQV